MAEAKDTFGVGFRPQHYGWVTTHCPPEIDVFEIVSENFMGVGGRPKYFLEKLRENYPVYMHGVSLSIGSKDHFDLEYLRRLKELIHFIQPKMVSDHLSWTQDGRRNSHDLLPIAYTEESMNQLAGKIGYLQDYLGHRFFFENPSAYVAFADSDYDEAGFFAELLKRTGAGILLDINNLYVNLRNLNQDPEQFLRALRPEDVGYFHLAGHSDSGDVLIDTHDQKVPDSVWSLYGKAREYFPKKPAVVEWDGNIPDFPELLAESEKARYFSATGKLPVPKADTSDTIRMGGSAGKQKPTSSILYSKFFNQIVRPFGITDDGTDNLSNDKPTPAATGLRVYNHAYFLRLEELLVGTYPGLAFVAEEEGFRYLLTAYLDVYPPMQTSLRSVGRSLPEFLRAPGAEDRVEYDFGVPLAMLGDLAALEWARAESFLALDNGPSLAADDFQRFTPELWETAHFRRSESCHIVSCNYDVLPALQALDKKEVPAPPAAKPLTYLVYRGGFEVYEMEISAEDIRLLAVLEHGATLMTICDTVGEEAHGFYGTDVISKVAMKLLDWAKLGFLLLGERPSANHAIPSSMTSDV